MRRSLFTLGVIFLALTAGCLAAQRALIVTGLSGSSENEEDFQQLATNTKQLLVARGFPADQVVVLTDATRDAILRALKPAANPGDGDEFWLVLFGHSGVSQGGVPAFQVHGPRFTATDMKSALDAMPGKQFVMIGTNSSGGFLPVLQDKRRTIVSATKEEGQYDQPRFPEQWVAAFGENPKAPFAWIAARASALVDQLYQNEGIVETETARLADPVTGTILEPPFGQNLAAPAETPTESPGEKLITASDIEIKPKDPSKVWEEQPATPETRKIIAEAKAVQNPDGYAAIMMEQQIRYRVEEDRTTEEVSYHRVYIAREEAVDEWANNYLPQSPPETTTRLHVARVIRPDGTALVFNPAKLAAGADPANGTAPGSATVFLPNVHAGCVVEFGYTTLQLLDAGLPYVTEAIPVQRDIPVFKSEVEVQAPEKQLFHVALRNSAQPPVETSEDGRRVLKWALGPIAAAEPLPGDAPAPVWQEWLGISSMPSWDEFATWYRRITKGSDDIDDTVKAKAAELSLGANTRMEKIRRAFEYVSALRYIAIEMGVQGLRPRTPAEVLQNLYGDCKDKANLLVALLRCMNVDARFVLINRESTTDVGFPSWQFNHAICFVPKDPATGQPADMWLDSTDSITPFGFIAPGDYGREALVFGPEKAEFIKVAGTGKDVSAVDDDWELAEDGTGAWSGTFRRRTAGLEDYAMRATFRGLSPAQKRQEIYQNLDGLWPAGDLSGAAVSDVSDLRQPVEINAKARDGARSLPRPDFPWLGAFCSPERDRPLLLNEGQPFAGVQNVVLHFAADPPGKLPAPVEMAAAGQTLAIHWKQIDSHTVERTAEIEFKSPTIAAGDYAAVRRAVRDWTAALAQGSYENGMVFETPSR